MGFSFASIAGFFSRRSLPGLGLLCVIGACGIPSPAVLVDEAELRISSVSVGPANVFVVDRDGKRLMVDAANPGDEAAIEGNMRALGIEPNSIDYLILTHGHLDHAGSAAYFRDTYDIKVIAGRGDAPIIANRGQAEICPTSVTARLIRWMGEGMVYPSFEIDVPIDGDFDLASFGVRGSILHLPGHTDGSIIIVFDSHYFVGDLIRGGLLNREQPTTHFFMCDLDDNRRNIAGLIERDQRAMWYPGHFGPFSAKQVAEYLESQ